MDLLTGSPGFSAYIIAGRRSNVNHYRKRKGMINVVYNSGQLKVDSGQLRSPFGTILNIEFASITIFGINCDNYDRNYFK